MVLDSNTLTFGRGIKAKSDLLKTVLSTILLIVSFGLVGCNSLFNSYQNPFQIEEINNKKDGRNVYVAGKVIRIIPLIKNGAYQLQDDTGKIWILTTNKLPSIGAKISVKGQIKYQKLPFSTKEIYLQEIDIRENKTE